MIRRNFRSAAFLPGCVLLVACSVQPRTIAALPGAEAYPAPLRAELAAALAARGSDYVPRTHHLSEDGSPEFTNRLILESSPYLLQHAHNPVNWYPWGDEAFETARRLGRPVLLSIGYSTCHWCHVMEEESFEDLEVAEFLNANYVAIKVDREERPDLDAIYMQAVYAIAGRGGWPMTTWLTPDRVPFYGGTYFPARDGDRGTRKGFLTLLGELKELYAEQPESVAQQSAKIRARIERGMQPAAGEKIPDASLLNAAIERYKQGFDSTNGGLKRAPKFPSSFPVRLLLRRYAATGAEPLREMAETTLEKMARGGLNDQIGGGFHRYSTDARWLVPHFEKMLYDNALLTLAYLDGYQVTGRDDFASVARETLDYVAREMTDPSGGFYSATDADSMTPSGEREEGWFFTWTPAELIELLSKESARVVIAYYGVTAPGNFEGRNILHVTDPIESTATRLGIKAEQVSAILAEAKKKLYRARLDRPAPLRDDKILTSWNGLMISAFAVGGFVLDEPRYIDHAERAAAFLLDHLRRDGRMLRSYKDGRARFLGYLDDYSFTIAGLIDLYEATSNAKWLEEAIALQSRLDALYADDAGGYFLTSHDHEKLLAREKPSRDGAEPSGNSIAAMNLLRLHELTTDDRYRQRAESLFRGLASGMAGSSEMLAALDFYRGRPKEIVIATDGKRSEAKAFLDVLRSTYLPNKVLVVVPGDGAKAHQKLLPMLEGKVARKGKPTAYVCERGVCQLPTTDTAVFVEQLLGTGR